jgi:hypothetical protein
MAAAPSEAPQQAVDRAADVSFGLEIKFLLLRPRDRRVPEGDLVGTQRHAYDLVARTVDRVPGQQAIAIHDIAAAGHTEREYWPTHWIVKRANSVEPVTPEDQRLQQLGALVGVELSSPRLRWADHLARDDISPVLAALKRAHQVRVNYTCDVHVHVGRADGRPFTLRSLKRLASLLWLAEPALRSVRDPRSPNFHNVYTWGAETRRSSRLAAALALPSRGESAEVLRALCSGPEQDEAHKLLAGAKASAADQAALQAIWRADSSVELGRLLSGPEKQYRRLGFNFSAFGGEDERAVRAPRTVEFRVLEGTLKEGLVLGWVRACGSLVQAALDGEPDARLRAATRRLAARATTAAALEDGGADEVAGRFGELMELLGLDAAIYAPFQAKIRLDRGAKGEGETL